MILVVPMAGYGSRFTNEGYNVPKPLIRVFGEPMIEWALKSIKTIEFSKIIFIILREHEEQYGLGITLKKIYPNAIIIQLDGVTEGQLATVLTAREFINNHEDLLIASCDTYIQSSIAEDIINRTSEITGIISVADMPGDRWSFAKLGDDGYVIEVAEKLRISNYASTGLYYFSNGEKLVTIADNIIAKQEKTRGEYYIIPVYQKLIERQEKVTVSIATSMWDMGTPTALKEFENYLRSL